MSPADGKSAGKCDVNRPAIPITTMRLELYQFLPGELELERGDVRDYRKLASFHYLPKPPATWAQIWTIRYTAAHAPSDASVSRPVAVGVLSYPVPRSRGRERYFGRAGFSRRENLEFANANLRTISRVIVHPQFRCLGLASVLVRWLCRQCDTRYVEAAAMMARAHPFFERAGMLRVEPRCDDEPVYFIIDRFREFPA